VVVKYKFNYYEMHREGKSKFRSHIISCCLIEIAINAGLSVNLDIYL